MNPQARNKATTLRWTQLGNTTAIEAKLYECECESVGGQRILVHFFEFCFYPLENGNSTSNTGLGGSKRNYVNVNPQGGAGSLCTCF